MHRRDALGFLGGAVAALATGPTLRADHPAADPAMLAGALGQFHLYVCAYHMAKKDANFVVEAHHFCAPVRDEVFQCVIFDKVGKGARILGVEYIISDRIYRTLPNEEKKYYHPHTYEVTAGLLLAPGLAAEAEDKLMGALVTTWGKTWHTWPDPRTPLPVGEPLLMWSATKDGHVPPDLLAARDKEMKISIADIRKKRAVHGPVPQIDFPRSLDTLGRQWTNDGPDVKPQ
jgi:hypothetical protein